VPVPGSVPNNWRLNQREKSMMTMAETVTTDLNQLDAFHALLPALAGALDIRDVFQRLSAVASRIVPHDEANLALMTDDGSQFRLYASTGGDPELVCRNAHCVFQDPIVPRLLDAVPGLERGLRSGVSAPVFIDDAVVGVFALFSRRPDAYASHDLALVQRLAGYVAVGLAHQRLAEAARHAAVDRARTASIESSVELLRTIAARPLDDDVRGSRAGPDRGGLLRGVPRGGAAHQDQWPQAGGRLHRDR
jgi:GAF domain-containing protein